MAAIEIILADSDSLYIEGIGKYIKNNSGARFNINIFTQKAPLLSFLRSQAPKAYIMLIGEDLFFEEICSHGIGITAVLYERKPLDAYTNIYNIHKYQPGERILSRVMELLADNIPDMGAVLKGKRDTRLIAVFSPHGGSGKTTVSIYLANQLSKMGYKVFYLNFETINSTGLFTGIESTEAGLSNIIFYLKQDRSSLAVRIESLKSYNEQFGIYYFNPACFSMELEDISDMDVKRLLQELKGMGQFDIVITDMESSLNKRNAGILDMSDRIILLSARNTLAKYKLDIFDNEVLKGAVGKDDFYRKVISVVNKHIQDGYSDMCNAGNCSKEAFVRIPYLNDLFVAAGGRNCFNKDSSMGIYLARVARAAAEGLPAGNYMR